MGLRDKFQDIMASYGPNQRRRFGLGGGIGNGHGMLPDDDMIVSKPAIVLHSSQIFLNFIALCCFASVAAFQAKWNIGPSGLSGFALFVAIFSILLSSFMLLVPVAYERYHKLIRLAHALKEVRVSFILTGAGFTFELLIAFVVTISAWTQPGCKDASKDPSAEANGDAFKKALPGWCITKKAAAIFFWIAFLFWAGSLALLVLDWRSGKLFARQQRDIPFQPPSNEGHGDEEEVDEEEEEVGGGGSGPRRLRRPRQDSDFVHVASPISSSGPPRPISSSFVDGYGGGGGGGSSQQQRRYSTTPLAATTASAATSGGAGINAGRPSMDAYGAFSDPAPTGFGSYNSTPTRIAGGGGGGSPGVIPWPEPDVNVVGGGGGGDQRPTSMMSRTMQYADPYAAVRAAVGGEGGGVGEELPHQQQPPSYDSYNYMGYR